MTGFRPGRRPDEIGASEAAAILGHDPWRTAYQLARLKLGLDPEDDSGPAAELGRALEPVVGQAYCQRTGAAILATQPEIRHAAHPWLVAHPDWIVELAAERRTVDAKTTRHVERYGVPGTDQVPAGVRIQVLLQATLADAVAADVEVLETPVKNLETLPFTVARDDELVAAMIPRLAEFRERVLVRHELPEPSTLEDLKLAFPREESDQWLQIDETMRDDFHRYLELRDQRSGVEAEMEEIKRRWVRTMLKFNVAGIMGRDGNPVVTFRATKGRVDHEALAAEHPDLVAQFRRETGPRHFIVTKHGIALWGPS